MTKIADWKKLGDVAKFVLHNTTWGRGAAAAVLNELEKNPAYLRFVEKNQGISQCMICAFYKYSWENGITEVRFPPQHACPDRR